jgi:signal transduction histidine kinase
LLNFHQIILRKFIFIFSILFLIVGAIVYYWSKDFYIEQTKDALLNDIEIISFELQKNPNLEKLAKKIKNTIDLRVTIIAQDGTVIAESHKNKNMMDNHKNRAEIIQSSKESVGYKIRHSKTIDKNLLYVAKKYSLNNKIIYIRLAKELKNINEQIVLLGMKIFGVLALFFITIFFITYNISREIEYETQKIVDFLTSMTKKKKTTYIDSNFSLEFSKITKLLTKVSRILTKKEKQKSKYTSKLRTSNKQKDDIISAISHEFKNPIAVINGYAQTLMDDENLPPNIRGKFLNKIYKNGEKLSDLIDTLRLSIKLENKKQTMNFTEINLNDILNDTVENIKLNYPNRDTTIKGDHNITIKADPSLFSVIISNLVENAFKYSEDKVMITFDEKSLNIKDNGIGISSKNLQNITNKFYRVSGNKWDNSLGLGLFIVNNIINLHNFSLKIKSKENEGSTFSVIF